MSGKGNGGISPDDYLATIEKIRVAVLEEVMAEVRPLLKELAELAGIRTEQKRELDQIERLAQEELADFQALTEESLRTFKKYQDDELKQFGQSPRHPNQGTSRAEEEIKKAGMFTPQEFQQKTQEQLLKMQKRLEERVAFRQAQVLRRLKRKGP
jgi:hypothetical protein